MIISNKDMQIHVYFEYEKCRVYAVQHEQSCNLNVLSEL